MQIEYLHEFTVLVSFMSFTRVSSKLNISQPTLSAHIAALEKEVGVPLLDRTTAHVALTPAGKVFFERASQIVRFYEQSLTECRLLRSQETLVIKQPNNLDYVAHEFSLIVTEFSQGNPSASVRVVEASNVFILDEIIKGDIDIGVVTACDGDEDFLHDYSTEVKLQPFMKRKTGIATRPDNPLTGKTDLTPSDLEYTTFQLPANLEYREIEIAYRSFFEHNGLEADIEYCGESNWQTFIMTSIEKNKVLLIGAEAGQRSPQIHGGYAVTPFDPPLIEKCYFVYSPDNKKASLAQFIAMVEERGVVVM